MGSERLTFSKSGAPQGGWQLRQIAGTDRWQRELEGGVVLSVFQWAVGDVTWAVKNAVGRTVADGLAANAEAGMTACERQVRMGKRK